MVDENDTEPDPTSEFLAQPSHQYEEDVAIVGDDGPTVRRKISFVQRLRNFTLEKEPSPYSSIAPRKLDGTGTKIFFFNGSGRGR
jgi:hypothetical protein